MAYQPIQNPQPVTERDNELGLSSGLTTYRDRIVGQRYTVLADSIADGLAVWWTTTLANGATVTSTAGEGLFQTSANAAGSASSISPIPPYLPGQPAWNMSATRFGDTGSAGNIRRIGSFTVSGTTPQDGFCFELNGTTLNAVSFKAGVATTVASTAWSVTGAPFTLTTNYHLFEIRWTANRADFYVDSALRHTASGGSTAITTTLNLPLAVQNINTSGATNRVLAVRNIGFGRYGVPDTDSEPTPTAASVATDRSGSVTTGGTAQVLAAANALRRGLTIQNTSSGDLRVTENGTTATISTGYKLAAGATATVNTRNLISVIGATTGQTWAATEF